MLLAGTDAEGAADQEDERVRGGQGARQGADGEELDAVRQELRVTGRCLGLGVVRKARARDVMRRAHVSGRRGCGQLLRWRAFFYCFADALVRQSVF